MLFRLLLIIFTFVELNCENLFDTIDDPFKDDNEYTENSIRHWDRRKYYEKRNNICKEIISCAQHPNEKGEGHMPDMIALCEVENDSVMVDMTKRSMLWSYHYDYLITHSPDARGINVALMYNPNAFKLLSSNSIRVKLPNKKPTRDILYAKGLIINRDTLHVFVVHSPSRRGGEKETRQDRLAVAEELTYHIDSLNNTFKSNTTNKDDTATSHNRNHIIVAGDFNDYSEAPALKAIEKHDFIDISRNATGIYAENNCKGTYFFNEEWNSLDHILVSKSINEMLIDCYINNNSKLLEADSNGNMVPKRSFRGIKYNHGFSDHLPLVARFNFNY